MEIYLMRHGANFSKEIDPDKPLSPVGAEQVAKSGQALVRMGIGFDVMLCSTKIRARQTADIIAEAVEYPKQFIAQTSLLAPKTPPLETVEYLRQFENNHSIFIAGHLPSLAELCSWLLTPGHSFSMVMESAGLIRLDAGELMDRNAVLRWYLTPYHLQLMA